MIFHKKFVFAHLTKTGGTFVKDYLLEHISGTRSNDTFSNVPQKKGVRENILHIFDRMNYNGNKHAPLYDMLVMSDKRYRFGFVRNPLSFYISLWASNIKEKSIRTRPKREQWFEENPIMLEDPTEFIKLLCDDESGKIKHFNFDIMKKMDIGVLTYRYLHLYFNHNIFNDENWMDNYKQYMIVDDVYRLEDDIRIEIERIFREHIFELSNIQKIALNDIPVKNKTNHKPYMDYYNKEMIDYVKHKERFIFKLHYKDD